MIYSDGKPFGGAYADGGVIQFAYRSLFTTLDHFVISDARYAAN
jgi:hypothetical protein